MKGILKKVIIFIIIIFLIAITFSPNIFADIQKIKTIVNKDNPTNPNSILDWDYIIITSNELVYSNFQILAYYKSQYLNTTIVSVESIVNNPDFWVDGLYGDATSQSYGNPFVEDGKEVTSNYEIFNDTQAKIRNYIRYAYLELGTKYILLGGDVDIIPPRKLRIEDAYWFNGYEYEYVNGGIRADLYYAALYGTYNDDFDKYFGEDEGHSIREEAEFSAEVYVGRAPVSDRNEVKTFVDKVIHYETHEKPKNIQLHQAGLNQINNPDSTIVPETCAQLIPADYNVYKLYSINERVTIEKYVNCFKDPDKSIVLHTSSGDEYFYYTYRAVGDDIEFSKYEVNQLDNTFFPFHISISCNSGDFGFDEDCLAETMLLWRYGGPSACIFNTDYGFATHDSALKYSGEFIVRQFYEIFVNETENLGKIMQNSKEYYASSAYNTKGYRWCIYTINLLGDPETPVFEKRDELPIYDEVFVDDDFDSSTPGWGEDHFNKIQDGINAVFENGFVYVSEGTYNENIALNKMINLFGEDKETTIIIGEPNYNTVTINSGSVYIKNFTITQSGVKSIIYYNGIKINPQYENNEIYNNIITENKQYGVLIENSCHNKIHCNTIRSNGIGVGLINPKDGTHKPKNIINADPKGDFPCDNVISKNEISQSDSVGVNIFFASTNHIRYNRFEDNCLTEDFPNINPNAFFVNPFEYKNEWQGNYWDGENKRIQPIYGRKGNISKFTGNIEQDLNRGFKAVEFDWSAKNKGRIIGLFEIIEILISRIFNNF